jgi:hypothetical protein
MNKYEQTIDSAWKSIFYTGGIAALLIVIFFRRNFGIELVTFNGFGLFAVPETAPINAIDWFTLLQDNWFVGLALFGLVDLVNYALVGLLFLALYGAIKQVNKSAMVIATVFGFVGITVYFATNQAFSMLTLSHRYAEATTTAQQAIFLAAGEALLAEFNPGSVEQGTGYYLSLFLVLLAGLIISLVMLHSPFFNKATAYAGILANGIGLGYFLALIFAPEILWLPPSLSALFRMAWYVLIAIQLLKLGKHLGTKNQEESSH